MYLHTMEFKTAAALHARLSQMEKIDLRRASPDRIDHLFHSHYKNEVKTVEELAEVKALCDEDMARYTAMPNLNDHNGYIPSTWRF